MTTGKIAIGALFAIVAGAGAKAADLKMLKCGGHQSYSTEVAADGRFNVGPDLSSAFGFSVHIATYDELKSYINTFYRREVIKDADYPSPSWKVRKYIYVDDDGNSSAISSLPISPQWQSVNLGSTKLSAAFFQDATVNPMIFIADRDYNN